jgi:CubicO group peptidase (beta-lactamase class C family)
MDSVRELMRDAVETGVFPGGVLLVARGDDIMFCESFGLARIDPERPMTPETVFDLASLTKPLATTLAVMLLIQEGRLNLDQTVGSVIPIFSGTNKELITIRQLLSHTAGLPDYNPYYEELATRSLAERKALLRTRLSNEKLVNPPGKTAVYSDVGFMILEWLIEVVARRPLNHFVEKSVYGPLGIENLFFIPVDSDSGKRDRQYAATEQCPWRGKVLDGEVHDDNAYVLGGVAGHAGLFGIAQDVYRLLKELLNVYSGEPNSGLFRKDMIQSFFQRQSDGGSWALGFDTPSRPKSSSGKHFSDQSIGHLGFTGTSFWVDLIRKVIVVLLTNRIHPSRKNEKIKAFRPVLHDRVMEAIIH